jgi:hypothetical protein
MVGMEAIPSFMSQMFLVKTYFASQSQGLYRPDCCALAAGGATAPRSSFSTKAYYIIL